VADSPAEEGPDYLFTVRANQQTLHRQIRSQFQRKRKILLVAIDDGIGYCRDITWTLRAQQDPEHIGEAWIGTSWIMELNAAGSRDGKPFRASHLFLTNMSTTPEAMLQLVRDLWSIENSWHWPRGTQPREDDHRYREPNGVQIMVTLTSRAMNALRLVGFWSITVGLAALSHECLRLLSWYRCPSPLPLLADDGGQNVERCAEPCAHPQARCSAL
jgi:predicted transposase YbfD/YdcC